MSEWNYSGACEVSDPVAAWLTNVGHCPHTLLELCEVLSLRINQLSTVHVN